MKEFHVYCDESHTANFLYRVQGGVWIPSDRVQDVRDEWDAIRATLPHCVGELKWKKLRDSNPRREIYPKVIDLVCRGPVATYISFKCLVTHRDDDPHKYAAQADQELGFYKGYYEFIYRRLMWGRRYLLHFDPRPQSAESGVPERVLGDCLDSAGEHEPDPWTIVSSVPRKSHDDSLVQLADVLSGAVAWSWNRRADARHQREKTGDHECRAAFCKAIRDIPSIGRSLSSESAGGHDGLGHNVFDVRRYRPHEKPARTLKEEAKVTVG